MPKFPTPVQGFDSEADMSLLLQIPSVSVTVLLLEIQ